MPPMIGKFHDAIMMLFREGHQTIMNTCTTLFGKDRQNFIFPITKLVSTFPCNDNKDGVEYVALIQKQKETEKDMWMLLDHDLRI